MEIAIPCQYFRSVIDGSVANVGCVNISCVVSVCVVTVVVFVERVLVIVESASGVKRVIVIAESLCHFLIFTARNVERKVLIELESVNRNHLNRGKAG